MNYHKKEVIVLDNVEIINYLPELGLNDTIAEIIKGLIVRNKHISSRFFYDETGSKLFEDITYLKEYYPTRTEKSILKKIAPIIINNFKDSDIVELGSGDCSKIDFLLREIPEQNQSTVNYIPVDVSMSAIEQSADALIERYPDLNIQGFVADFMSQLHLLPNKQHRLFCFFGSTIGNLEQDQAKQLIQNISSIMNKGDRLLLGMDLVKSVEVLHAAYNDSEGVTAEFNLNILNVINDLIGSSFSTNDFAHKAFFNIEKSRIEMYLVAKTNVEIYASKADLKISIKKGESIHTENSHKYTHADICNLAEISDLKINHIHKDDKEWFALIELEK